MTGKPAATRFDRLYGSLKGGLTTDEILAMTRGEDAPSESRFARLRGSLKSALTTDEILAMTRGEDES